MAYENRHIPWENGSMDQLRIGRVKCAFTVNCLFELSRDVSREQL